MAFVVPVAVGAGIAITAAATAGAGVGGTALGIAICIRNKMKHTSTVITQVMNLTEGDHISLKTKRNLPFSHAIVVSQVTDPAGKVQVAYHSGSKSTARVDVDEVNIGECASNGELFRHQYEELICYARPEVIARALSLSYQYNTAERREILRNYLSFFSDDEHFADWCQIGFTFSNGMKAMLSRDYTQSPVTDLGSVSEGDHVVTSDGKSAIVVGVAEKMAQVELVCFPTEERRGPGKKVISLDITKLNRMDYDIAIGFSGQTAKQLALEEFERPTEPMPYTDGEQFCVWCKTATIIDTGVASALARARVLGRVWAWVRSADELRIGDHIAFNSGVVYYYQHAIVVGRDGHLATVVFLQGNMSSISEMVVKSSEIDLNHYIRKEQMCRIFHGVAEWYDSDEIVSRANSYIGFTADRLPFKDPQDFACWCKSGSSQNQSLLTD